MSAYLVRKETIDDAVDVMNFERTCYGGIVSAEDCDELGRRLWDMNARAVSERYDEAREVLPAYQHRYTFAGARTATPAKLKAAQCLLYQCSEGTVPELALYHELEKAISKYTAAIVAELPEYKAASWG